MATSPSRGMSRVRDVSGAEPGQYEGMADASRAPSFDAVLTDLETVRAGGVGRARSMALPALSAVARLGDFSTGGDSDVTGIVVMLKEAVDTLGGGSLQEAGEYALGLYPGTALWKNVDRRRSAAEAFGVVPDTFRKNHEKELLGQIAEAVLRIHESARMRRVNIDLQERVHPADSRLAVQWVERFEAYNRIWTPAWALAADLEAAIDTYREGPSEHPPWDPQSTTPYDYLHQAQRYGRDALYRLTCFWLEVKRFMGLHGGMWLFSAKEIEDDVSDAIYRIGWHNSLPAEDESFLRRQLADARHQEIDTFWRLIEAFPQTAAIERKWQQIILDAVKCETDEEKAGSQAWLTIRACNDYCTLVDDDWLRIADWYRPAVTPAREPLRPTALYRDLVNRANQARP